jgi:uncharacterized membrane protein
LDIEPTRSIEIPSPEPSSDGPGRKTELPRWLTALLLLIILVIAGLARSVHIHRYCYFFDEAWNDEISTGRGSLHVRMANDVLYENVSKPTSLSGAEPWWRIWTHVDRVTHPPLYFIVLRWWRDLFGESPVVSRALSTTVSVVAILLLFDVARLMHGTTAALWGCAIMALAGAQVELAQETRSYAMLLMVSLAALTSLVRLEKLGPSVARAVALGAAVLMMVLTHYFASAAALAIGVYVIIRLRGRARRDAAIALIVAAIAFFIAWGPFLWQQRANFSAATENWMGEPAAGHVGRDLRRLAEIPLRLLIEPPRNTFPLGYVAAVLLIVPFVLLVRRREMLLWCLWICGTIFFIAAIDMARSTQHLAYIRYTLLASPAIYMSLAALVPTRRRLLQHLVPACMVVACLGALPEAYEQPKPEFRLLASYLDNNVRPGDAVVFYASGDDFWFCSALYLNTAYYARSYPWPFVMMTHPPDRAMLDRLRQFQTVWLVNRAPEMSGEKLIPGAAVGGYQFFPYVAAAQRLTTNGSSPQTPLHQPTDTVDPL